MYMDKARFGWVGRLLNQIGWYELLKKLVDVKLFPSKHTISDYYKYSTGSFLIKHFSGGVGHEADFRTGHLGFGMLHYSLITILKPERVLCIGSEQGFIPAVCAMACKDNGKGRVDFVDAGLDREEKGSWGGKGFWKKNEAKLHFSPYDLRDHLTLYVMRSGDFAKKYKRKYDYIYIDADHSYEGVKADFRRFWPRLAESGIMSFHDISLKGLSNGEEYGVWKFWKEMAKGEKFSILVRDNGVGFLRKES